MDFHRDHCNVIYGIVFFFSLIYNGNLALEYALTYLVTYRNYCSKFISFYIASILLKMAGKCVFLLQGAL